MLWGTTLGADHVAMDGGRAFLYASDTLAVSSIAPGETSATKLGTFPAGATELAADASRVYATVPGIASIVALPRSGGTYATLATAQGAPHLLTAGPGWIAWQSNAGVMGCDPAACNPTVYGPYTATSIAVDARAVYWTETTRAGVFMTAR